MENLRKLTDPLVLAKLSAPGGMAKNLLLTLYWLAEADMAGASVEQVVQELSRRGRDQATPADSTMAEVLLFNYHTARHLGVLNFAGLEQLGRGLLPSIPESDDNPRTASPSPFPFSPPTASLKSPTNCSTTNCSMVLSPNPTPPPSPPVKSSSPKN